MGNSNSRTCNDIKTNEIEKDSELVYLLVLSAKSGNFDKVFEIIGDPRNPKNGHLLNCIPDNRRWGVIHQAVYWRKSTVLKTLLSYPTCDTQLKAKECTSECGETSRMTARDIAYKYGYHDVVQIIDDHKKLSNPGALPTFQRNNYMGLISITLASYKNTFHPGVINSSKSIVEVLHNIFESIKSNNDIFEEVKKQVCDCLMVVSNDEIVSEIEKSDGPTDFFGKIIKPYTIEKNEIYTRLNISFRKAMAASSLSGDDLALGPYAVVYQMLLLFWHELQDETRTTFRQMKMTESDIEKYAPGTEFYWSSVVSSTIRVQNAQSFPTRQSYLGENCVLFLIENSAKSRWRPKNIECFAKYDETERTYPAGAKFRVTQKYGQNKDGTVFIFLELLRQSIGELQEL